MYYKDNPLKYRVFTTCVNGTKVTIAEFATGDDADNFTKMKNAINDHEDVLYEFSKLPEKEKTNEP